MTNPEGVAAAAMMARTSPLPSITLLITKRDGERFLEASQAVAAALLEQQQQHATSSSEPPLHVRLFDACQTCRPNNALVAQFLDRISSLTPTEQAATALIFHDSDKSTKLRELFGILSTTTGSTNSSNNNKNNGPMMSEDGSDGPTLSRSDVTSLFRSILMSITACLQCYDSPAGGGNPNSSSNNSNSSVIVEGQPPISDRPLKKTKLNHHEGSATTITKDESHDDLLGGDGHHHHLQPAQSNSWDSSLATHREEDDPTTTNNNSNIMSGVRKEVEDIAQYATNDVFKHAQTKKLLAGAGVSSSSAVHAVDFLTFGNWYNDNGGSIVPWIELLRLAKWKAPRTTKATTTTTNHNNSNNCTTTSTGGGDNKENAADKIKAVAPTTAMGSDEHHHHSSSPDIPTIPDDGNRTLVSFDFNGSGSPEPLVINISEDNILALTTLVSRTGLMQRPALEVCRILARYATFRSVSGQEMMILRRSEFHRTLQSLVPDYIFSQLKREERDSFMESFFDLFGCFEDTRPFLHQGEVDLKEFAVGFCFLCAGNKSAKLAAGFEFLDAKNRNYLTEDQLLRYLQSYLTMLVGMSLLVPAQKRHERLMPSLEKKRAIRQALEHGAKWTLSHFLKASGQTKNEYTFEVFASWYSSGGFNIAPWLELLDLSKVMSLTSATESLGTPSSDDQDRKLYRTGERRIRPRDRVSSLRRHHQGRGGPPPEVLFTFPLGSRRSLVVLKEDALYVSGVVEQLGLWNLKPDDLWIALSAAVDRRRHQRQRPDVAVFVDMKVFTESMMEICPKPNRKRAAPGSSISTNLSMEELISNFFQCFDIEQTDRVALDELMGGLTLLCGGKKSQKLAFAFSIFDTRPGMHGPLAKKRGINHSLSGEDLFLFLRSILIVTFSTCRQSLDMSDETVGRFIADAANMICNDVMRHQWETKQTDRVDFDEFGQWYNDGGFERAPWLELLDLLKWVVVDTAKSSSSDSGSVGGQVGRGVKPSSAPIPLPLPDDSLDNSFFDTDAIMPIDSMDDMDMILMQGSHDQGDFPRITKSFSYSNSPRSQVSLSRPPDAGNPLKFHLNTDDPHGGFMLSLSKARIAHFRHVLSNSKLHLIEIEEACNKILSKANNGVLSKADFDAAIETILPTKMVEPQSKQILSDIFNNLFAGFDHEGKNSACALEVACGFTVLCRGKKSDKLELAFEVLDKNKNSRLSQDDMTNYLRSFLIVLLSIAFSRSLCNDPVDDSLTTTTGLRCDRTTSTLKNAASEGAKWASSLAFADFQRNAPKATAMSFDDFADWYTSAGYSSIPWLELLDLQKWAMND